MHEPNQLIEVCPGLSNRFSSLPSGRTSNVFIRECKVSCPPAVFRVSQERVSLSWEARALDGLELPTGSSLTYAQRKSSISLRFRFGG